VYFTAGLFDETHGLFGALTPVAAGTPEGPAEQQRVTAALDVLQLAVQTFQADLGNGASRDQLRQDQKAIDTAIGDFVRAESTFVHDEQADQGGLSSAHGHSQETLNDLFAMLGEQDNG
jgi:hypothetical protein